MELSLVITVFNEEENIGPLLERIREIAVTFPPDYEVIFIDDGSKDGTVHQVKKFSDAHTRLLVFNKNYGQTSALAAGIQAARGKYIATLDGDLQNDPADIPMMLDKLQKEHWDVVAGVRAKRKDNLVIRKVPSKIANWLIRRITGVHLNDYGCSLRVFRADIAKNMSLYGELHRFIPVLAALEGARMTEVDVRHHPRLHGSSKYGLGRTFKVMSDLILMAFYQRYFGRPIHLFGKYGLLSFGLGSLIFIYLLILKLLGEDIWGRPLLILGFLLIIAGIQLISLGLIAEIQMRTYYESQNKRTYRIREEFQGKGKAKAV